MDTSVSECHSTFRGKKVSNCCFLETEIVPSCWRSPFLLLLVYLGSVVGIVLHGYGVYFVAVFSYQCYFTFSQTSFIQLLVSFLTLPQKGFSWTFCRCSKKMIPALAALIGIWRFVSELRLAPVLLSKLSDDRRRAYINGFVFEKLDNNGSLWIHLNTLLQPLI